MKEIRLDFFELGFTCQIPYSRENTSTAKAVKDAIKKHNLPCNGRVKITRNDTTQIVRYANCELVYGI